MLAQIKGHSPIAAEAAVPLPAAAALAEAVATFGRLAVIAVAGVDKLPAGAAAAIGRADWTTGVAEIVATCAEAVVEPPIANRQAAATADAGPAPTKRVNLVPVYGGQGLEPSLRRAVARDGFILVRLAPEPRLNAQAPSLSIAGAQLRSACPESNPRPDEPSGSWDE